MVGIPLTGNKTISWCFGFLVPSFQSFKNQCFLEAIDPILPNFYVVFLIDTDLIFKMLKNLLDGSLGFYGSAFSKDLKTDDSILGDSTQ